MPNLNNVKTDEEIKIMKKTGEIASRTLKKVLGNVREGITCESLDKIAQEQIRKAEASPSFMTVDDYRWTICTTVNDQVVHGIPKNTILKDGDIIGVDIGAYYRGFHSDMAITVGVGTISAESQKFLDVGRQTLRKAILKARVGNRIGDISAVIQKEIEQAGYSVVRSLTGHGIGRELHEEPPVPCFGRKGTGPKILANMVLAIEVIYTQGSGEVKVEDDNWTIVSVDGSLGGLFEQTVAVTKNGHQVLTLYL